MKMAIRPNLQALFTLSCLVPRVVSARASAPLPDVEVASREPDAIGLFNAVHSALRQWGSSAQHNGLSFIPVTIPGGNIFYHGTHTTARPSGLEWLAFEMEHASLFAISYEFYNDNGTISPPMNVMASNLSHTSLHGQMSRSKPNQKHDDQQKVLVGTRESGDPLPSFPPNQRGYFHTYRATRPLKLVYIDGMAAAKCDIGSLDSQDYILLDREIGNLPEDGMGDQEAPRATDLCVLAKEWDVDGWIRMEAGFEIIYCDFSEGAGLDLVSVHGSPWKNETGHVGPPYGGDWRVTGIWEWMRAVAARYHGFPRGRVIPDFSGMVSAFAYDVNITNPDESRPELPRIVKSTREGRRAIKTRLGEVLTARAGMRESSSVDWQRVVDDIVSRYSHRLWIMADANISVAELRSELATLVHPFLTFPADTEVDEFAEPLQRCTDHFLLSARDSEYNWTPEDQAIHAAVQAVSRMICQALFEMRKIIHTKTDGQRDSQDIVTLKRTQTIARELKAQLSWTTWKECGHCPDPMAMCIIAMFPMGGDEDHFSPRCKRPEEMAMGYFSF